MRVMAFFSTLFFETCLRVADYSPWRMHPYHIDTFLVSFYFVCFHFFFFFFFLFFFLFFFFFCFVFSFFPVVPQEGFTSYLWHFLGIFTCNVLVSLLVILHIVF